MRNPNGRPVRRILWCAALGLAGAGLLIAAPPAPASRTQGDFDAWLRQLEAEALQLGISHHTIESALGDVEPIPEVLQLDRSQPKRPAEFCGYMGKRLTRTRIARAKRVMTEHRDLLQELNAAYGVPARYLVALWGLETNFGDYMGTWPVVGALTTLAYDPRRSDMFREQLLAALRIIDEGHQDPAGLVGSWAGATGHVQLMPSTFLSYAVDYDGDGRKNVWTSTADALATAANYLRQAGWRGGETWGRQVSLPGSLESATSELRRRRPLSEWQARGVRRIDGGDLPDTSMRGSIVLPKRNALPAFLVYGNYHTFLEWNRSTFFAISVGTLADAVSGAGAFRACGA